MSLKEQIKNDIKDAMRAKETVKRNTLRNIQAAIKQIEVDERRDVSDADVETIITPGICKLCFGIFSLLEILHHDRFHIGI